MSVNLYSSYPNSFGINNYSFLNDYNNIKSVFDRNTQYSNYDMIKTIDYSGNLIYVNNKNFKETIPNSAILEDSKQLINFQSNMFIFSCFIAIFLLILYFILLQ
jgi:hypothetical protein